MINSSLTQISDYCNQCRGECYDKDQAKRQSNAAKRFGLIPKDCVDSFFEGCKCPFQPK